MRCPSCASGLPSGQLIPPGAAEPPLPPPGQLSLRARVFGTCGVSPDRCASSGVVIAVRVGAAPSAGDGFRRATCPLCRTACRPAAGAHLLDGLVRCAICGHVLCIIRYMIPPCSSWVQGIIRGLNFCRRLHYFLILKMARESE